MGDQRDTTNPRPPHPATVARTSSAPVGLKPRPAQIAQRAPMRAGVAQPPHPAAAPRPTIGQPFRAPSTRPPHPATVSTSVVQRANVNPFDLLNQVNQQNELKPAYVRKLRAEAKKESADAEAKKQAQAEAKKQAKKEAELRQKQAEAKQKQAEREFKAKQAQVERKAARVVQSVDFEQDDKVADQSLLSLKQTCQIYASTHGANQDLERHVKFTTAMSIKTGNACSRPSGVLTLSNLQGMSNRFYGTISGVKQAESWPPHACAEVYATAALLQKEPQLKLKDIVYYTMDRESELVPMCANCQTWISGTFNP